MTRRSEIATAIDRLAPSLGRFERGAILDHAVDSPGLRKACPEEAAWLAMVAFIRHQMTEYDDLLAEGYDVESARHGVAAAMRIILAEWGVRRPL